MSRPFTFGSDVWPGLAKLVEEAGEVLVEAGNLILEPENPIYIENLEEELADVIAAAWAVAHLNKSISVTAVKDRVQHKLTKHRAKHKERKNGNVRQDRRGQHQPRGDKAYNFSPSVLARNPQRADDSPGLQPKRKKLTGSAEPGPAD